MTKDGRFNAVWNYFQPPVRLYKANFDDYIPKTNEQAAAAKKCSVYAENGIENISQGQGLFMSGSVGTGKTHLAIATVRNLITKQLDRFGVRDCLSCSENDFYDAQERKYDGLYCSFFCVVDLLNILRQGFNDDYKRRRADWFLSRARGDELIVLDDIGAEKTTDWVLEQLYSIIDLRYRMQRSTIITSNCSIRELEAQIGPRTVSRIIDMTNGIKVEGPDYRKRKLA